VIGNGNANEPLQMRGNGMKKTFPLISSYDSCQ